MAGLDEDWETIPQSPSEVAVSERNPLVDLGSLGGVLKIVLTKMRTLERAEIFADGGVILECSFAGPKVGLKFLPPWWRELAFDLIEDVHIFPFLGFLEIQIFNDLLKC